MAKDAGGNEGGRESESERQREIGGALASVKERSWRGGRALLNRVKYRSSPSAAFVIPPTNCNPIYKLTTGELRLDLFAQL